MSAKPKAILFVEYTKRRDTITAAQEGGYKAILITRKNKADLLGIFDEVIHLDLEEKPPLDELIKDLRSRYKIQGILSNYEHFVVQRSYLAERFGLPSTSVYNACCTRNKVMQREALKLLDENIEYEIVSSYKEAQEAFQTLGKNVYIKSIAGIKSSFVEHITTEEQLKKTWKDFQKAQLHLDEHLYHDFAYLDFDFPYPDPKRHLLIEKAYEGQQIAVAAMINSHRIWHAPSPTDVYTAKNIGHDDSFLAFRILASKISPELAQKADLVAEKVIRVLGLKNCAIHLELIVTPEGDIKIIEVASRLGGYRGFMYHEVYRIDLPKMLIYSAINKPIKVRPIKPEKYLAMHEIFPDQEGTFHSIRGLKELEQNPSLMRIQVKAEPGEKVGPAKRAFSPVMTFAIAGESYEEVFEKSIEWQNKLAVQLNKSSTKL